MRILFVNAFKTRSVLNWIVALWTRGKYCHVELLFSDGYSFAARPFAGGKCSWARPILTDPSYEIYEIVTNNPDIEQCIRVDCRRYVDKKYDYLGILGFVFKSDDFEHKNRYFCSELLTYIIQDNSSWRGSKEPCRMSPNRLFNDIKGISK